MGDGVDERKVEDFVDWLEKQSKIRRISNTPSPYPYPRISGNQDIR